MTEKKKKKTLACIHSFFLSHPLVLFFSPHPNITGLSKALAVAAVEVNIIAAAEYKARHNNKYSDVMIISNSSSITTIINNNNKSSLAGVSLGPQPPAKSHYSYLASYKQSNRRPQSKSLSYFLVSLSLFPPSQS